MDATLREPTDQLRQLELDRVDGLWAKTVAVAEKPMPERRGVRPLTSMRAWGERAVLARHLRLFSAS